MLRRLYLEQLLGPAAIATRLGGGATREIVQGRIVRDRLASLLDPAVRAARRLDALDKAVAARRERRTRAGQVVWTPAAIATLRRSYLDQDVPPAMIARALGFPVLAVRRRIRTSGLAAERRDLGKGRLRSRNLSDIPGLVVTRVAMGVCRQTFGHAPDAASLARAHANSRRTKALRRTAGAGASPPGRLAGPVSGVAG